MCLFQTKISVYRQIQDKFIIIQIDSQNLVPGDIIIFEQNTKLPCDCVIINGNAIVNECSLTGESIPIRKSQIQDQINQNNTLFEGTELLQSQGDLKKFNNKLSALVLKTGFITTKGILVRNMYMTKQENSQFKKDSYKFIGVLGLFTFIGFLILLNRFKEIMSGSEILLKLCDLITITIPPTLTVALSIGIMVSMQNLSNENIFCISPQKIIDGGEIDTVCFDKTGTLTQNFMKLNQLMIVNDNQIQYSESGDEQSLICMAVCNSLILDNGNTQGDHMEVAMFEYSKAIYRDKFKDIQILNQEFKQISRFDFASELERMSVIVQNKENQLFIYTKGSPEKMKDIITNIPSNYEEQIQQQAQKGYRLLALAYSPINEIQGRKDIEQNLKFLGFALLENQLKSDSLQTIISLNEAQIKVKMITGDNILTAVNIAQQCKISQSQIKCLDLDEDLNLKIDNQNQNLDDSSIQNTIENYKFDIEENKTINNYGAFNNIQDKELQSVNISINSGKKLCDQFIQISDSDAQDILKEIFNQHTKNDKYAITGKLFNRLKGLKNFELFVDKIEVFARMSPDLKIQVITLLQKQGKKVAMVGDGANDCGALKEANIGLSLSQTEASIAAPFTAKDLNVSAIISLIRESRAGLVTAFQLFKFISLYSQIQFTSMLVLYNSWTQMSSKQFVFIDLFTDLPFFITLSMTKPYQQLSIQKPSCNLMQFKNMLSVFSAIFIQLIGQIVMFALIKVFTDQNDFESYIQYFKNNDRLIEANVHNMAIFLFSNFLYMFAVVSFSNSKPFRQPFYTNVYFCGNIVIIWIINNAILILNTSAFWVDKYVEINFQLIQGIFIFAHVVGFILWNTENFINKIKI